MRTAYLASLYFKFLSVLMAATLLRHNALRWGLPGVAGSADDFPALGGTTAKKSGKGMVPSNAEFSSFIHFCSMCLLAMLCIYELSAGNQLSTLKSSNFELKTVNVSCSCQLQVQRRARPKKGRTKTRKPSQKLMLGMTSRSSEALLGLLGCTL